MNIITIIEKKRDGYALTKDEIMQQIEFQEQYFHTEIRM